MDRLATVLSGLVLAGSAVLVLWFLTHPGDRGGATARDRSRRRWNGALLVGLLVLAGAFFYGLNFLPAVEEGPRAATIFVVYWSVVLILALVLLLVSMVSIVLLRRRRRREEDEALRRSLRRTPRDRTGKGR